MIRRAVESDIEDINRLLLQVCLIHHNGRPDIFKYGAKKSNDEELRVIIHDDQRPIFVAELDRKVAGYAFCVFQQHVADHILTNIKTLYIDDLCVDENVRGQHIGKELYKYVVEFAKSSRCYNVTLNVWCCNEDALRFYEKCGLTPQKIQMETIL